MSRVNCNFVTVSPSAPCEACGRPDWCRRTTDGRLLFCRRASHCSALGRGLERNKGRGVYWIFRLKPGASHRNFQTDPKKPRPDLSHLAGFFTESVTDDPRRAYASQLGIPLKVAFEGMPLFGHVMHQGTGDNRPHPHYVTAEVDGSGKVVGYHLRPFEPTKRKSHAGGTARGIAAPTLDHGGPIFVVEGRSDERILFAAGLPPSAPRVRVRARMISSSGFSGSIPSAPGPSRS